MQHTEMEEGGPRWLLRVGIVAMVLAVAGVAAFFIHLKIAGSGTKTEPYTEYTVGTMTLRATVTSSGVAVAQNEAVLSFSSPGQLSEILVNLGDTVHQGQPLMRLKADAEENASAMAASALALAQLQLQKLEEGASASDMAEADKAVTSAQSALTKAQNDLQDALDPATAAEMTKAQDAVATAESQLSAAEAKRNALTGGASDADIASAEANVAAAQTAS